MQYQTGLSIVAALRQILGAQSAEPATVTPIRAAAAVGSAPAATAPAASTPPRVHAAGA